MRLEDIILWLCARKEFKAKQKQFSTMKIWQTLEEASNLKSAMTHAGTGWLQETPRIEKPAISRTDVMCKNPAANVNIALLRKTNIAVFFCAVWPWLGFSIPDRFSNPGIRDWEILNPGIPAGLRDWLSWLWAPSWDVYTYIQTY